MTAERLNPELSRAADVLIRDVMSVAGNEHVLVTVDTASEFHAASAVQAAAHRTGANAALMLIPQLPIQGALSDPYLSDAVKAAVVDCDVWVDMTWPYIGGSSAFEQAMAANRARYVLVADLGVSEMVRMFATVDMEKVFEVAQAFEDLLAASVGKRYRIANDAGTDVRFTLGKPSEMTCGRPTGPGPWFVPGTVMVMPDEETVEGRLVLESVFHEYYTLLPERISVDVEGKIHEVSGNTAEIDVLKRALYRAAGGMDMGAVIHFTCGFHPGVRFCGESFIEDQRVPGFSAVGMGRPFWAPGGGENHPDGLTARASHWLDDELIVEDGAFVGTDEVGRLARELTSLHAASIA